MADLSPKIGRISGIEIQLHWTFILLLLFILVLSFYLFLVWVLLFVCVLIHELVHSITSKRNKIKVKKIVLYPFGGGSIIDFEKVKPDTEFRISIVGPIASLLIAAIVGIATIYSPAGIIRSTMQILFLLNVFLGVFNLLPWLPLDGGRALRSYLQKSRSYLDATRLAVKSSNVVTVLFVGGTIVFAVLAHGYSTLYREFIIVWDVAIAFFIYSGAKAEMQMAFVRTNISDLKAKDAITDNFIIIKTNTSVKNLYNILLENKTNIIIFKKGNEIRMLSNQSLQRLLKTGSSNKRLEDLSFILPVIPYNTPLYSAIERMRSDESGVAVVTKGSKIEGMLLMQHINP